MSEGVQELLARAENAGVQVELDGERLLIRGPREAQELGRLLLTRKAEVLPFLQSRLLSEKLGELTDRLDEWNRRDPRAALDAVCACLDAALASGAADAPAKRNALEVYRRLAQGYFDRCDPLLFETEDAIKEMLARWREA